MTSNFSIEIENLSKLYYLGGRRPSAPRLFARFQKGASAAAEEAEHACAVAENRAFWALRNINLQVPQGEVLGIIGRNGAGKSTLLKILSRITEPTAGRAVVRGRVVSLLEVGTGFHDELTGRENIVLNATILGMDPNEIRRHFDSIVDFSGIERFIDTPVKFYSSGMRVRLGFSVAAHVEPDVLIIDEVLAVGDLAFQEKCLKRVDSLTQHSDRTVLFVSHSMGAIANLCPRAMLLDAGQLAAIGPAGDIIRNYYQDSHQDDGSIDLRLRNDRTGGGTMRFVSLYFENEAGLRVQYVTSGSTLQLVLEYETPAEFEGEADLLVNIVFINSKGNRLFGVPSDVMLRTRATLVTNGRFSCQIDKLPLMPGNYELDIACLRNRELADKVTGAASLVVVEGAFFSSGRLPLHTHGDVLVNYDWELSTHARPATSTTSDAAAHTFAQSKTGGAGVANDDEVFNPAKLLAAVESKLQVILKNVVAVGQTLNVVRDEVSAIAAQSLPVDSTDTLTTLLSTVESKVQVTLKSVVEVGRTLNIVRDELLLVIERPSVRTKGTEEVTTDSALLRDYLEDSNIRETYPTDLFPGLEKISIPVGAINEESGHYNQVDLLYVAAIAKFRECRRMFEIGTYQGRTTYHLTLAAEDALVYTLNLPPEEDPSVAEFIGCWFKNTDRERQIRQIFKNSSEFDPTPYAGQMDLVFVDGDHSYEAVKNDTEKALQMLAPGGIVLWHDFATKSPGVVRYLREFSQQHPLFRLKHTCLALYIDGLDVAAYRPPPRRLSWVTKSN